MCPLFWTLFLQTGTRALPRVLGTSFSEGVLVASTAPGYSLTLLIYPEPVVKRPAAESLRPVTAHSATMSVSYRQTYRQVKTAPATGRG